MRRRASMAPLLLLSLGAALVVWSSMGRSEPTAEPSPEGALGRVEVVTPIEHDLGEMMVGQAATLRVEMRNSSNTMVRIASVHTTCGCTIIDGAPESIGPGAIEAIVVKPDTTSPGRNSAEVWVGFEGEGQQLLVARVRFAVVDRVQLHPSAPHLVVGGGASSAGELPLVLSAPQGLELPKWSVSVDRPGLVLRTARDGNRGLLWIAADPEVLPRGQYYAKIRVTLGTEDRLSQEYPLLISHDLDRLEVRPRLPYALPDTPGGVARLEFAVLWNGAPVAPSRVEISGEARRVGEFELDPEGRVVLVLDSSEIGVTTRLELLLETPVGEILVGALIGARFEPLRDFAGAQVREAR